MTPQCLVVWRTWASYATTVVREGTRALFVRIWGLIEKYFNLYLWTVVTQCLHSMWLVQSVSREVTMHLVVLFRTTLQLQPSGKDLVHSRQKEVSQQCSQTRKRQRRQWCQWMKEASSQDQVKPCSSKEPPRRNLEIYRILLIYKKFINNLLFWKCFWWSKSWKRHSHTSFMGGAY